MSLSSVANISITVCSFLFIVILSIFYFPKKKVQNIENKIYSQLLIWNIINLISYLFGIFAFYNLNSNEFLIKLGSKMNGCATIIWFALFATYILIITNKNKSKKVVEENVNTNKVDKSHEIEKQVKKNNKTYYCILLLLLLMGIIAFVLPMEVVYVNNIATTTYGLSAVYYWLTSNILIIISLFSLIKNIRKVSIKKIFPLLVITILLPASMFMQGTSIFTLPLCMTLISYIMFFTIENPDFKLINELTLAKNQAEKSNKAKTDFLSSMSHEIRTPLNAIVGLSEMISHGDNIEEMKEDSKDILNASETLLELVNGILDINKLEANKMEIVEVNYKPIEVFNDLVRMIKVRIGEKPLELRTHFSNNLPVELYGDREKIKMIITNFLTNSVKYTDKGFIDFNVDCINEKEKCILIISVTDTGRGIKNSQKEYLFTKFYRLEEDKDTDIEGTGLGLAITKSLVELLNGKITVDSVYGQGSTFSVTLSQKIIKTSNNNFQDTSTTNQENILTKSQDYTNSILETNSTNTPIQTTNITSNTSISNIGTSNEIINKSTNIVNSQSISKTTIKEEKNNNTMKKRILIVDDNKLNLKVASKLLVNFNFDVQTANSGFECIERINNNEHFDLIFMDIMMPNMNGIETMHKLKSMPNFKIPIISLTADAVEGSHEKYVEEGFDDYVSKPIDQMTLEETLEKFINLNVICEEDVKNYKDAYKNNESIENNVEII